MSASVTPYTNYPVVYVQFPVFSGMFLGFLAKYLTLYAVDLNGNIVKPASMTIQTSGSPTTVGTWPFIPATSLVINSSFYYPQSQFYLTTPYNAYPMLIALDYPALAISIQFNASWTSP